MSFEPHQASANHFSVVEFANIIVTLHHSESGRKSQPPTPGSFPLLLELPSSNIATSFKDFIPHFFGRDVNDKGREEDSAEFIENLNFAMDG